MGETVPGSSWTDNLSCFTAAQPESDFGAVSLETELPALNIPGVLQSLDTNVTADELQAISEAIQVHLAESSWSLHRPTASAKKLSPAYDTYQLPLSEQLAPRVICAISTSQLHIREVAAGGDTCTHQIHSTSVYKGLTATDHFNFDDWAGRFLAALDAALKKGAHLISFGEFDYPSHIFPDGDAPRPIDFAVRNVRFVDQIYERLDAETRPVLLFAGTHHAWREGQCMNIGLIFHNRPAGSSGAPRQPVEHFKTISAKSLGEVLAPFQTAELPLYGAPIGSRTKAGRIGVLICVDAFDATVTNSIFAQSTFSDGDRYGIILVPAYNASPRLFWSCQSLSYRANCFVLYVNAMPTRKWEDPIANDLRTTAQKEWVGHRRSELFACGIPISTWKEQVETLRPVYSGNPRAMAALQWPESVLPEAMTRLMQLTQGLNVEIEQLPAAGTSEAMQLKTWTIPNGLFSEIIDFMDRRQPESMKRVRKHIVTRRNNHLKRKSSLATA